MYRHRLARLRTRQASETRSVRNFETDTRQKPELAEWNKSSDRAKEIQDGAWAPNRTWLSICSTACATSSWPHSRGPWICTAVHAGGGGCGAAPSSVVSIGAPRASSVSPAERKAAAVSQKGKNDARSSRTCHKKITSEQQLSRIFCHNLPSWNRRRRRTTSKPEPS